MVEQDGGLTKQVMQHSTQIGWWFSFGVPLLLAALFFQTVTLVSGHYASVLITALTLTALADACFVQAFRRGGLAIRCISVLLLLPTLFVVADFIRRAPHSFQ